MPGPIIERPPQRIDSSLTNNAGGQVGVTQSPPQSNYQVKQAELRADYVSGSGFLWIAKYIRSLPHYIDDITRDLGTHTYEKMLTDPQVASCIRLLTIKIIEDGIQLDPAIKSQNTQPTPQEESITADIDQAKKENDQEAEEAELASKICDWCADNLDNLARPFQSVLYEMLEGALTGGNKVGEEIWELKTDDDDKVRLHLKDIKTKPRETTAYVVDAYMSLIGLLAMIPGQGWPIQTGTIVGDPKYQPNMLPKEKFFILTWNGKGNDPRGTSLCRCVYTPWFMKINLWTEYAKYLSQFASAMVVGKTAQGAQPMPEMDSQGNPIPGGALIKPEDQLRVAIEELRNGAAIALPFGTEVQIQPPQGQGNAIFNAAIQLCNQEIAHGILCQALATEVAPHMSRAASQSQQTVLDEVIVQERMNLAKAIKQQILYRMVLYNWGRDVADKYTPNVRAVQTEARSWAKDAAAISTLVMSKYVDPSQYPELDAILGLPKRDPEALQAMIDANMAALKMQASGGMPGAAPPGGQPPTDQTAGGAGGLGTQAGMPGQGDQSGAGYPDPWGASEFSEAGGDEDFFKVMTAA